MHLEKQTIKVFTTSSFESVTSIAILEELLDDTIDVEVEYTKNLDFRDVKRFKDYKTVIILGVGYNGYNLPESFYMEVDNPFTDFIHVASWGEQIKGEHVISIVNESFDPIVLLYNILIDHPQLSMINQHTKATDKAKYMIKAVNDYRTWNWYENKVTNYLLALYHGTGKYMPNLLKDRTLNEVVKENQYIISGQMTDMSDYIQTKVGQARVSDISVKGVNCKLKVIFAERYINELANRLLEVGYNDVPTIVCVGRPTKGSDLFYVRTKGVDARDFVEMIDGQRKGKENVGSFFSGVNYSELMLNSTVTQINS